MIYDDTVNPIKCVDLWHSSDCDGYWKLHKTLETLIWQSSLKVKAKMIKMVIGRFDEFYQIIDKQTNKIVHSNKKEIKYKKRGRKVE